MIGPAFEGNTDEHCTKAGDAHVEEQPDSSEDDEVSTLDETSPGVSSFSDGEERCLIANMVKDLRSGFIGRVVSENLADPSRMYEVFFGDDCEPMLGWCAEADVVLIGTSDECDQNACHLGGVAAEAPWCADVLRATADEGSHGEDNTDEEQPDCSEDDGASMPPLISVCSESRTHELDVCLSDEDEDDSCSEEVSDVQVSEGSESEDDGPPSLATLCKQALTEQVMPTIWEEQ